MRSSASRFRRLTGVRVLSLLGVAVLLVLVSPTPASAVFPGGNGRVAYTLYKTGSDIYTVAPNGTNTHRLTFDGKSSHPRWSPNGRLIAFQRGTTNTTGAFTGDLYVMRANGSGVRRVTVGAGAQEPAWSPQADALMFVKRVNGHTDLY